MDNERLLKFLLLAGKLKGTERTGWKVSGVKNPESVADHSFRTALMAYVMGKGLGLDTDKAIRMSLIHDIAEAITGDIITWNNLQMNKEERARLEANAIERVKSMLGSDGQYVTELWREFEEGNSKEARFVRALDKLEAVLQSLEYKSDESQDKLNEYIETFLDDETTAEIRDSKLNGFLVFLERRFRADK